MTKAIKIKGGPVLNVFQDAFKSLDSLVNNVGNVADPVDWVEKNLGVTLYSNQIEAIEKIFSEGGQEPINILASRGAGKCVDGDVLMADGRYQHISKVSVGDFVMTMDEGRQKFVPRRVLSVIDSGVKNTLKVVTNRGSEIYVSPEHPFFTDKGWQRIDSLKVGNFIATCRNISITDSKNECDDRVLKVLAYLIGDGCLGSAPNRMLFSSASPECLKDFEDALGYFDCKLGIKGKDRPGKKSYDYGIIRKEQTFFRAKEFEENKLCSYIKAEGLNKKSNEKFIPNFIPNWIFSLPLEKISLFLSRLYATDGWASTQNRAEIGYCSVSKVLALDVKRLLLRFGIPAAIRVKYPKGGQPAYQVTFSDRNYIIEFCKKIGIFSKEEAIFKALCCAEGHSSVGSGDFIPRDLLEKTRKDVHCSEGQGHDTPLSVLRRGLYIKSYSGARRFKVLKAAEAFKNEELLKLAKSDLYWETIKEISVVPNRRLWDLSIEGTHNFICNELVAHNTYSVAMAIVAYCILYPGLKVIFSGPKEKQAGRILKEMESLIKSKVSKVRDAVDWGHSSALRMQFFNGSWAIAISAQPNANIEGDHGHSLAVDEAHLTPDYSMTNKLTPMVGMLGFQKIIKVGVSMGKNHFYKSCTADKAVVCSCNWRKAEAFFSEPNPLFYKNKQVSRILIGRMPVPYKKKYFPDRPDLWKTTGLEVSVLDWLTQYEMEWVDDLQNFLSAEDQELLSNGTHSILTKGYPNESYYAGLDTAGGSITGHKDTDETVLSIWRKNRDGRKERVASYVWIGDPIGQMEEIWAIINPTSGLFKCRMALVDYSNIGASIVEIYRKKGCKIMGKVFGSSEPKSKLNYKNAMFKHFQVQLQTEMVKYPNIEKLKDRIVDAPEQERTQIENQIRGFWEWVNLQRIKGRGLNDVIQAPTDRVENEDAESGSEKGRDDFCSADVLACWAADFLPDLLKEYEKLDDSVFNYTIPDAVIGGVTSAMMPQMAPATGGGYATAGRNPIAQAQVKKSIMPQDTPNTGFGVSEDGSPEELQNYASGILDGLLSSNRRK